MEAHPSAQTALDQQSHYFRRSSFSDFFSGIGVRSGRPVSTRSGDFSDRNNEHQT
jgi:hypothetical protein